MAVSPWSAALRSPPGYADRPASTTVFNPNFPALPALPSVPAIDESRAPNSTTRSWLLAQLDPLSQQNNAALTNIRAGAKLSLAGYGGWSFAEDNPNTPQREDLQLNFDPNAGPGQREKTAIRDEQVKGNAAGMLYSSFTNQNIAGAVQRLSLEAQQIANQYAGAIMSQQSQYAGQVSNTIGQWTQLYGADAAYLAENPPPAPAPAPPPPPAPTWRGSKAPNKKTLAAQWGVPESDIDAVQLPFAGWLAFQKSNPPWKT